jgi:hypothetical protein
MATSKPTKSRIKKVEKEDAKNKDNDVREGKKNASILGNKKQRPKREYPRESKSDEQFNNQPEFTEPDNNVSKNK